MLSQKRLRTKFALQLALAGLMLIAIFSALLYNYVKITMLQSSLNSLNAQKDEMVALVTSGKANNFEEALGQISQKLEARKISAQIAQNEFGLTTRKVERFEEGEDVFLRASYPFGEQVLTLAVDVSGLKILTKQILENIVILNIAVFALVIFYAMFLSRILLIPLKTLSLRLANLNERLLRPINENDIALEFQPLVKDINALIRRILGFLDYQKELFVGIAHELKTPLAVMKTKNEVTLLKPRESEKYIEALQANLTAIDQLNQSITSVLQIGRLEGAQFEKPQMTDMSAFLHEQAVNFAILARATGREFKLNLSKKNINILLQRALFLHILQNFIQNAIKFSNEGSVIELKTTFNGGEFNIIVLDEGAQIEEGADIFAPFKRFGQKGGVGLGLFLAKSAAEAIGAQISVQNRSDDVSGVVSTLTLFAKCDI